MRDKIDTNNLILAVVFIVAVAVLAALSVLEGAAVLTALLAVVLPSPFKTD